MFVLLILIITRMTRDEMQVNNSQLLQAQSYLDVLTGSVYF